MYTPLKWNVRKVRLNESLFVNAKHPTGLSLCKHILFSQLEMKVWECTFYLDIYTYIYIYCECESPQTRQIIFKSGDKSRWDQIDLLYHNRNVHISEFLLFYVYLFGCLLTFPKRYNFIFSLKIVFGYIKRLKWLYMKCMAFSGGLTFRTVGLVAQSQRNYSIFWLIFVYIYFGQENHT